MRRRRTASIGFFRSSGELDHRAFHILFAGLSQVFAKCFFKRENIDHDQLILCFSMAQSIAMLLSD
jgi:hypothetical protein